VDLATTRVPRQALEAALAGLDPDVRAALEEAARRTRRVHGAQIPSEIVTQVTGGLTVTGRFVPVGRAGVYVPGGLVAYPSSVVMNIVPAQAAGVASIAVASPPQAGNGGLPHPSVLRVRPTRRDRGARGRRRAGAGHVRLRHPGLPVGR